MQARQVRRTVATKMLTTSVSSYSDIVPKTSSSSQELVPLQVCVLNPQNFVQNAYDSPGTTHE